MDSECRLEDLFKVMDDWGRWREREREWERERERERELCYHHVLIIMVISHWWKITEYLALNLTSFGDDRNLHPDYLALVLALLPYTHDSSPVMVDFKKSAPVFVYWSKAAAVDIWNDFGSGVCNRETNLADTHLISKFSGRMASHKEPHRITPSLKLRICWLYPL